MKPEIRLLPFCCSTYGITGALEIEIVESRILWNGLREITRANLRCIRFWENPPALDAACDRRAHPFAPDGFDDAEWCAAVAAQGVVSISNADGEYYQTDHWHALSDAIKSGTCEQCGAHGGTRLHHVDAFAYGRLGCERRGDVRELCDRCHFGEHARRRAWLANYRRAA